MPEPNKTEDPPRRRWKRILLWVGGVVAVLGLVVVVAMPAIRRVLLAEFSPTYQPPQVTAEPAAAAGKATTGIELVVVAKGFAEVTDIQFVPGTERRAIVVRKKGKAHVVDVPEPGGTAPDASDSPLVVDLEVRVTSELGLLGLAFHPKYEQNGLFYLNDNPADGGLRSRISEWKLAPADLGKKAAVLTRVILEVEQPYQNHDAGQLAFGPDGMLYVGMGDGGWMDDPHGHGQDLSTLLGAMLRIDVDRTEGGKPYAIPPDNPFVGREDARPEIWAYGLRNPWRYSFDPRGRLIVADVGQNEWEEVDIVSRGDNLGWKIREGRHCFEPKQGCRTEGLVEPTFEYGRSQGKSITGGYVVTGSSVPSLKGKYLVADFESGRVWALELPASTARGVPLAESQLLGRFPRLISTFGIDAGGEVYIGDYGSGDVLRIVAAP